ncbi:hypothetical protein PILCRDRAFT_825005 [Piloderma croceum F 1598]|uniref:Uncharacterized protein n=1 Tax=Piloderma croceum (strain F 1598) TaxID=765440 RepID=A0A0C3AV03_PILCF|nr:hypothetical protein PILCRDRAFT_825005 [Piloderma croceum F 1598]
MVAVQNEREIKAKMLQSQPWRTGTRLKTAKTPPKPPAEIYLIICEYIRYLITSPVVSPKY